MLSNLNFKGHSGRVVKMEFVKNGSILLSAGVDGIIYQWDISTGQRIEILTKEASINDFIYIPSNDIYYVTVKDQQSLLEVTRIKRRFKYDHILNTIQHH